MLNESPLLLSCIRASLRGILSQDDARALFGKTVEWDRLLNDAQISGTSPLLYHTLKDVDGLLPGWVMSRLQTAYYSAFTHNISYYRELSDILSSFKRSGIQVIILKGAVLAETLYPDISLRPFSDIDLLIRDQDLLKAESDLQYLDYEKYTREFRQGYQREFEKYSAYLKRGRIAIHVDLHTRLFPFAHAQESELNGFWDRAVVTQIGGNICLVLSAEDTVLHLCAHIFKHGFQTRLLWFYDIALMISKYGESLNWKLIEKNARTLGVYGIVGFVLDQVRHALDISLPQSAASWAQSYKLGGMEKLSSMNESSGTIWYYFMKLRSIKGVKDRLRFVIGRTFPNRDYIMWRYSISNPRLTFFGYCYHLYRLHSMLLGAAQAGFALIHKGRLSSPRVRGGSIMRKIDRRLLC